jgi:OmpA-OmpF porin, OOP family
MKKITAIALMMLFGLLSANLYAEEKDADGCKENPLILRMPGYYIAGCSEATSNNDIEIKKGDTTETIHIEGKSTAWMYSPQPDLKSKPSEIQLNTDFESFVKGHGGTLLGITFGQEWPIYKIVKDGKEIWIILLMNHGEYFNGTYTARIVVK